MAVTQKEIARQLGISRQLVGFALGGSDLVSEETRERVLRAASDLGYRPNGSARVMRSGRNGSIALLTSTRLAHSYTPSKLLDGIHAELSRHDMHLVLGNLPDEKLTDDAFVPKILREWMTDGLLINYIQDIPQRLIQIVERHQMPAVWLNSKREHDCIRPNDLEAGRMATEYLLKLGHKRIAFVDFSHTAQFEIEHYSAGDRWLGYTQAMRSAGLEPRTLLGKEQKLEVLDFTREWLSGPERPTAVVAYTNEVVPIMAVAMEMRLRVPEDLSLVCFGSEPVQFAYNPVTTFVVPEEQMGQEAVKMLNLKIEQPSVLQPATAFSFSVSEGRTVAPLPFSTS